ncbi:hypothetical protein Pla123a_06010 [Posidoniimonas polymericola]|uniref:DUF4159 domain-containing protein n=1 Tax=Posidoniimonas polymericola TaxID=2528002 RepID=A0A5C5ZEK3_9BACT|nr:DUF4159 domain-containing protein [Posidoniimonas polymericola]TWT85794.1 hypothetical protein Pla123a_06010 [Posidoniimonas polymericola]
MRSAVQTLVCLAVAIGAFAQPLAAQPADTLDPEAVRAAIRTGVVYLKDQQKDSGRWDEMPGFQGGITALCTLALLNAGVEPDDPTVEKALDYLRRIKPDRTYCVSLKIMVLAAATPKRDLATIQECVKQLESTQHPGPGIDTGGWSYPGPGADPSNAQFATLALHEAQRVGAKVSLDTWRAANGYWRRNQNADGSWSYSGGQGPSGSMTCAGIAALVMTGEALNEGDARIEGDQVRCCVPHEDDDRIERALSWMGRNFSVTRNPASDAVSRGWLYYYLYALERVGRLTAHRFIGEHDWYREGTEFIVSKQDPLSKYWTGGRSEKNPHVGTSLALLFLSKGRRPVLMAKLDYGDGWNQHQSDAAHLTAVAERAWRLDLTWQQLDPEGASVEDLLQAPVIYLSGSNIARLTQHAEKLRAYVDRGGFLFAEACCGGNGPFRRSVEQLVEAMFPEPEYRLRQLRPAHPIWRMERAVQPDSAYLGKLWAVEYGCRTCVIYCDEDLSCYWELDRPQAVESYPATVRSRVKDAEDVGLNVLAYATNRKPLGKEQVFVDNAADDLEDSDAERGVIRVAKLQHGGGCNDAPGALANLTRAASQGDLKLRVSTDAPLVSLTDESLFTYHVAFIHGRHEFGLTQKERDNLRDFLTRGGTLLGDAICASDDFTRGFRRELLAAIPGAQLERVPPDDPIFTDAYGGYDIRTVKARSPQPVAGGQPLAAKLRSTRPVIEGIKIEGRWAVLYSPYDLSCALEKHEAVECRGYSREDAARIGLNVLLYSINY